MISVIRPHLFFQLLLTFLCSCLLLASSLAQSPADDKAVAELTEAQKLLQQVQPLYAQQKFDEAIPLAERALPVYEKYLGAEHQATITAAYSLAHLYRGSGRFAKAAPLFQRALTYCEKSLGATDTRCSLMMENLGEVYSKTGDAQLAESLLQKALAIKEKNLGAEDKEVSFTMLKLADVYKATKQHQKAAPLYERVAVFWEQKLQALNPPIYEVLFKAADEHRQCGHLPEATQLYERTLRQLEKQNQLNSLTHVLTIYGQALLSETTGDLSQAAARAQNALAMYEKLRDAEPTFLMLFLTTLGQIALEQAEYRKAEPPLQRALTVYEQNQAKAITGLSETAAQAMMYLGEIYRLNGEFARAETMLQRALALLEKSIGTTQPQYAQTLSALASVSFNRGQYEQAEEMFLRALTIAEKAGPQGRSELFAALNNLGLFYVQKGEFDQAEPLLRRAFTVAQEVSDPTRMMFAASLGNLGLYYLRRGDYKTAITFSENAVKTREASLGAENVETAKSLLNLASVYYFARDEAKAEAAFQRSLKLLEKSPGAEHPDFGLALNNLAALYLSQDSFAKAEPLALRAFGILEKTLGADHSDTIKAINNLGAVYAGQQKFADAEKWLQRALNVCERGNVCNRQDVVSILRNLAFLNVLKNDLPQSLKFLDRTNEARERDFRDNLFVGSEQQKLLYLQASADEAELTIWLHNRLAQSNAEARRLALLTVLRRKGRALDATAESFAAFRRHAAPQDQQMFEQLSEARSRLATLTINGAGKTDPQQYRQQLRLAEAEVTQLENELTARSAEFRLQSLPVSLEAIQRAIPEGAMLVEFASYREYDIKSQKFGARRYAAYTLNQRGDIGSVDLGEADRIDDVIKIWRDTLRNPRSQNLKELARVLDAKVMQPIRALTGNCQWLLVSPDGALNLIPFSALINERNQYLVEDYLFTYLSSGRDLLRLQTRLPAKQAPVIVANPDFGNANVAATDRQLVQEEAQKETSMAPVTTLYARFKFAPLPGTADEGKTLQAILPGTKLLSQQAATKAALKQIDGPSLLHIATHGFFLADATQSDASLTSRAARTLTHGKANDLSLSNTPAVAIVNPLLRSGLALAGANDGANSNGILTAMEVAGLSLWGTKLVTLSACETGVGEIKTGEGVYGLRRALVIAGSESQMMSLWPVNDAATRDLMIDAYKAMQSGTGISEALRQAQLKMLADPKRNHPAYWASFIQAGYWGRIK